MNPIAMFLGLILLAASVFYVASPFRSPVLSKRSTGRGLITKASVKPSSEKQRQAILLALRDLDFDYQAGKVAEDDYQTLRVNLVNEAGQLMQIQEREKEDSIEALIQSHRQLRSTTKSRTQEEQPAVPPTAAKGKTNGSAEKSCHHCQAPLPAGAKFCSKCGTPVEEIACPKCQKPLMAGDRFCPSCGTAISSEKLSNPSSG